MSFVEIKDLYTKVGSFELKNINMSIKKGEFLSVVGRSGSGKTVFLESIAGLHKIKGKILIDGVDITDKPPQKRQIGMVYQDYMLFSNMNVKKNILYPALFHKSPKTQEIFSETVSFLGIYRILDRNVKNLSGGEKQKVAIARALLSNPKLLLLDEPLNAIDLSFKFTFIGFLKNLHKRYELTVIYVTHNFKEAMFLSDRSVVMLDGEIYQEGKTDELFKHPKNKKVAEFFGFKNILPSTLINLDSHRFFSVSPDNIAISASKPNKEFIFEGEIDDIVNLQNSYKTTVILNNHKITVNSKNIDFSNKKTAYIGFDKKDIQEFD